MPSSVPSIETLGDLLRVRAAAAEHRTAYIHLRDNPSDDETLTFGALDRQSRAVAAMLQARIQPGERVLICHDPGLDYLSAFFGCLYAGAVAVPVYPPRFTHKLERLAGVADDCAARVALTSPSIREMIQPRIAAHRSLADLDWLETGNEHVSDACRPYPSSPDTVAFLQYTSGSTSVPKGVMLTHRNVLANLACIREMFGVREGKVAVSWLPQYHDMGLIGMMLGSMYTNTTVAFMSPYAFVQKPVRWLRAISRFRAAVSGGPNFAYDLCVRRVTDAQLADLDLSAWENAFCGAEPISSEILFRFAKKFAVCGFRADAFHPCYGMAEAALAISGGMRGPLSVVHVDTAKIEQEKQVEDRSSPGAGVRAYVGCGKAAAGHALVIVDPSTCQPRREGEVGEIWYAGPSVAKGYWNRATETAETFEGELAGARPEATRYLKTGDLGFLRKGELFVMGRIKEVMILHGRNIHPQDIERSSGTGHSALRGGSGAAFSIDVGKEERLVIVQELDRGCGDADLERVAVLIRERIVEDHGIRPFAISLVQTNSMPRTSSGKVQRFQVRFQFLEGKLSERFRFQETGL